MSSIFNKEIKLPPCNECAGDMFMKNEYGEILQDETGRDIRCSCYLPSKYLDANIGYDYWFINPDNWRGDTNDLKKVTDTFKDIHKLMASGQGFFFFPGVLWCW